MNQESLVDIASYLRANANELGSRILSTFPPLQNTTDAVAPRIATMLRKALPAQALAITGTAKYLRQAKAARIVAECGAGKTYMALGAIHVLADGRPSTTLVADQTGLTLTVCHFPPGTSKWNKVEHRLFSFISSNWRGEPLRDYETVVRLIAGTTTAKGLKVTCRLDHRKYPVGRKITDEEFAHVNLKPDKFNGEWNYTIHPRTKH